MKNLIHIYFVRVSISALSLTHDIYAIHITKKVGSPISYFRNEYRKIEKK